MALITSLELQKLSLINPMAQAIQDARYAVVSHDKVVLTANRVFDGGWLMLVPFALVALVLIGGAAYFKSQAKYFAENL
jgi:ABC-type polysaccharide/polyol phosphate export permease